MLQNNFAPNISHKLSSNQWPVILGSGLYATYRACFDAVRFMGVGKIFSRGGGKKWIFPGEGQNDNLFYAVETKETTCF